MERTRPDTYCTHTHPLCPFIIPIHSPESNTKIYLSIKSLVKYLWLLGVEERDRLLWRLSCTTKLWVAWRLDTQGPGGQGGVVDRRGIGPGPDQGKKVKKE